MEYDCDVSEHYLGDYSLNNKCDCDSNSNISYVNIPFKFGEICPNGAMNCLQVSASDQKILFQNDLFFKMNNFLLIK